MITIYVVIPEYSGSAAFRTKEDAQDYVRRCKENGEHYISEGVYDELSIEEVPLFRQGS
jgi:hypothetical protein